MVMRGLGGRRLAATVILVRDAQYEGKPSLEVYIQERVSTMPNFPRASVFPGGRVDERDFSWSETGDSRDLWHGPSAQELADRLGTSHEIAYALVFAAVRELFEETGTLLAEHRDGSGVVTDAGYYHPYRKFLESHEMSLTEVLEREDLALQTELIKPFAVWASPEWDKESNFHTFTFIAEEPKGQEPDYITREASSSGYFPPALILEGWRAGLLRLVIPTWAALYELTQFSSTEELREKIDDADLTTVVDDAVSNPRYAEFYEVNRPERF